MATQEKFAITIPGPPPTDLSSYTRSMHQHTMRQIEQMNKTGQIQESSSSRTRQTPTTYTATATSVNGTSRQDGRS